MPDLQAAKRVVLDYYDDLDKESWRILSDDDEQQGPDKRS